MRNPHSSGCETRSRPVAPMRATGDAGLRRTDRTALEHPVEVDFRRQRLCKGRRNGTRNVEGLMRTASMWCMVASLVVLAAPLAAVSRPAGGGAGGGYGRGARGARNFDPGTVTTVQGEVLDVERIPRGRRGEGVHLVLAAGSEKLAVHLGPAFFVDEQSLKLAKGDRIEVKGSRVVMGGAPALIAQEIKRGGESMVLRDADGVPLWSGARGRGR
jgi:hypothetical protein